MCVHSTVKVISRQAILIYALHALFDLLIKPKRMHLPMHQSKRPYPEEEDCSIPIRHSKTPESVYPSNRMCA